MEFLPKRHRIIFTKKANDGTITTRKLLKMGYKNIVAVGGDGTINEIAKVQLTCLETSLRNHR